MAKILVMGASHGIGLETVKALLGDGHHVRAFSRSASRIAIDDARLEKLDGDATRKEDVARALLGIDVVVQTLGVGMSIDALVRGTTLFSRATRILVDLMQEHGPRRLLTVTGLGAGDSRGKLGLLYDGLMFPIFLKRVYDDKDVQERMIRNSSLEWTIARPGVLVSAPVTGRYRALTDPAQWEMKTIARADVARFLADEIAMTRFIGKTPLLILA